MNEKPQLSIITPVFNSKTFIRSCLENVITEIKNAKSHSVIEHIICDGASTDGTIEIIKAYASNYPHIQFFSEKDTGQSNAMNKGIRHARGPVIGFLNVDDFYENGTFKLILKKIKKEKPLSLWMGNCQMWGDKDIRLSLNKPKAYNLYQLIAGYETSYNPSAYFYHKRLHDIIGYYDEADHYTMDLDFLIRAYGVASLFYTNATWGNFRFIPGAKTFEDAQKGAMFQRCDALRKKAFDNMKPLQQLIVKVYQFKMRIEKGLTRHINAFTKPLSKA